MSAMTRVALVVAVGMGALALVVLLQFLVTILVWMWRERRPALVLGRSILKAAAARLASPATSRPTGSIAAADWLAGAGWGAAVYGLAGPLAMAAPPSRIGPGAAGFVLGVLSVALVSPACRPLVRWDGIRASLAAGAVAGMALALWASSGLAAWLETLGPGVWLLLLTTCVAGGAGLGAALGASGVIAPMRLLGDWAPSTASPPDGARRRMQSAITLSAISLWLGSGAMLSAMMLAASLLWIDSLGLRSALTSRMTDVAVTSSCLPRRSPVVEGASRPRFDRRARSGAKAFVNSGSIRQRVTNTASRPRGSAVP